MTWSAIIIEILKAIAAPQAAVFVGCLAYKGVSVELAAIEQLLRESKQNSARADAVNLNTPGN